MGIEAYHLQALHQTAVGVGADLHAIVRRLLRVDRFDSFIDWSES